MEQVSDDVLDNALARMVDRTQLGLLGIRRGQLSFADRSERRGLPTRRAALRTNRAGGRLALLGSGRGKGWVVEYARPVLDELDAAVEGSAIDHIERDVGVAVIDAL